jgi:hypothetical protein
LFLRLVVSAGAVGCGFLFYLIATAGLPPVLTVALTIAVTLFLIGVLLLI